MIRFLLILFLLVTCGCDPYKTAWSTTAMVREAAFQTEAAIAKGLRDKVKECSQKHAAVIKSHNDCVVACSVTCKLGTKECSDCKLACRKGREAELAQYTLCVKPNYDANEAWIKYGRTTINSALTITVTSIQLAEATKDKKLPWLEYLQPGICALLAVLQQWKDVLPDNVKSYILLASKAVSSFTCKK